LNYSEVVFNVVRDEQRLRVRCEFPIPPLLSLMEDLLHGVAQPFRRLVGFFFQATKRNPESVLSVVRNIVLRILLAAKCLQPTCELTSMSSGEAECCKQERNRPAPGRILWRPARVRARTEHVRVDLLEDPGRHVKAEARLHAALKMFV
jgi:hypothetical protein